MSNQLKIRFKRLVDDKEFPLPARAHGTDAGMDLRSAEPTFIIEPGEVRKVNTGFAISWDKRDVGKAAFIFPRSGLATKFGIVLANSVGVVDYGYTGPLIAAIRNDGKKPFLISYKDRIVQLVFMPVLLIDAVEVGSVNETARGAGGFGSTGS